MSPHAAHSRMPWKRTGHTRSVTLGGAKFYLTANSDGEGALTELFAKFGKEGNTLGGLMEMLSTAMSVGLQHGVPLEFYVSAFLNTRFEPAGMTDDPEVPAASSIGDYLARRLAMDFLPVDVRRQLGVLTEAEQESAQVGEVVPVG